MTASNHLARQRIRGRDRIQCLGLGTLPKHQASAILADITADLLNLFAGVERRGAGPCSKRSRRQQTHKESKASYGFHNSPYPQNTLGKL